MNFLIDHNFTPCIGFDGSAFSSFLPKDCRSDQGLIYLNLKVIKNIEVTDDFINAAYEDENNKKMQLCILFDSIKEVACLESKSTYYFPEGDFEFNIITHIDREYHMNILKLQIEDASLK